MKDPWSTEHMGIQIQSIPVQIKLAFRFEYETTTYE